jgi:thiol-disulfide isomerase/thioredoxin
MSRFLSRRALLGCAALLSVLGLGAAPPSETTGRARVGERFPTGSFAVFNAAPGTAKLDLATVIGQKPVVLCYWIPGNARSDQILRELLALTREIGRDKLAVFAAAVPNESLGLTHDVVRQKIVELGVDVPVLHDEGFVLGKQLDVRMVPHINIIDAKGVLRLANGASLKQVLEYKLDLAAAIRRVAANGELLTYGYLDPYFPVKELEGQPAPEFRAPLLTTSAERSLHSLIDDEKLNVLIFWSVNCPHCRQSLPEINAWAKENPEGLNILSCASAANPAVRAKTREFCEANGLEFPTLVDEDAEIGSLYMVTATPTILIIRPDGVVDSAITSSLTDFGSLIERKKRELLKPSGS